MKKMGALLITKKKYDKRLQKLIEELKSKGEADPKSNPEVVKVKNQIKELQLRSKKILKAGNEYKENNPAACRYAYI